MAKRRARSLAAKRGWETRRAKQRARSLAAKKGWRTRRRNRRHGKKTDKQKRGDARRAKPQQQVPPIAPPLDGVASASGAAGGGGSGPATSAPDIPDEFLDYDGDYFYDGFEADDADEYA